jgi:hypothetical protein
VSHLDYHDDHQAKDLLCDSSQGTPQQIRQMGAAHDQFQQLGRVAAHGLDCLSDVDGIRPDVLHATPGQPPS